MKCEGIPASGGIGIGTAVLVAEPDLSYGDVVFSGVEAEKARLSGAVAAFIRETSAMAESLREQLGDKQAEILSGQVMMVSDPYMTSQMNAAIENGICAEAAADSVCGMYVELFSSMEDELMRQRALDVEDLRRRLLSILLGRPRVELNRIPPDSVLVARDFTPSMTAGLRRENVTAIVTESGGTTSHSAILARTMSLPAVLSVPNITDLLTGGETLVVDGSAGTVLVNPEENVLRACRSRQAEEMARQADLIRFRSRPTHTADGEPVSLCCNITSPRDVPNVLEHTGEGVGLFRTEFLFMNRSTPPSEEEQFRIYQDAARRLEGRKITSSHGVELFADAMAGEIALILVDAARIAQGTNPRISGIYQQLLIRRGVALFSEAPVLRLTPEGIDIAYLGALHSLPADTVVTAVGTHSVRGLEEEAARIGWEYRLIGDARQIGDALSAIREGAEVGRTL